MPPDLSAGVGRGRTSTSDGLRAAHAALLRQPVLALETDPQGYSLARRHLGALRAWHQRRTGWLVLARGHTLRLVRSPGVLPMGVLHPELASPRDVACLAWALAFAHHPQVAGRGIGRQFLLTELTTAITDAARADVRAADATLAAHSRAASYDADAPNAAHDARAPEAASAARSLAAASDASAQDAAPDAQAPDAPRADARAPQAAGDARSLAASRDVRVPEAASAARSLAPAGDARSPDASRHARAADAAPPAAAPFDFARRADAHSLRRALRALVDLGLLRAVDGSEDAWLDGEGPADALYEFTDAATTFLAGFDRAAFEAVRQPTPEPAPTAPSQPPQPWSTAPGDLLAPTPGDLPEAAPAALGHLPGPAPTPAGHLLVRAPSQPGALLEPAPTAPGGLAALAALPPLQRAWRALLGGPVFVRYDDPAAFAALWEARRQVSADLEQLGDELLDITPFYARLVRPAGTTDPGDARLSLRRALDHAVLCFCSHLRAAVAAGVLGPPDPDSDCLTTTRPALARVFEQTVAADARHWGRQLQARAGRPELFDEVCGAMRRLGLLRGPDRRGTAILLPTAAAYTVSYAGDAGPQRLTDSAQDELSASA